MFCRVFFVGHLPTKQSGLPELKLNFVSASR